MGDEPRPRGKQRASTDPPPVFRSTIGAQPRGKPRPAPAAPAAPPPPSAPPPPPRRSPWRLVAIVVVPVAVTAGGIALLIPRGPEPIEQTITRSGIYEIGCDGCDMGAGTWRTVGDDPRDGVCMWARKTTRAPSAEHVIAEGRVRPGETATVRMSPGEWFTTMWCGPWERVAR